MKLKSILFSFILSAVPAWGLPTVAMAADQTVIIENMKFNPDHLEIHAGDTVTWINKDIVPHTVTAEKKSFHSGDIASGSSWKKKFKHKGTFPYKCSYHPVMKANLQVR